MGGAASKAAGRSYAAAKETAAKAAPAANRHGPAPGGAAEPVAAESEASASSGQSAGGIGDPEAVINQATTAAEPRWQQSPMQDSLRPRASVLVDGPGSSFAAVDPQTAASPLDYDDRRDDGQAAMLDRLGGAIRRHDAQLPPGIQAPIPTQRRERPKPDNRPAFSIEDLHRVFEAAQAAVLKGQQPDVDALARRYKVDAAGLKTTLQTWCLPVTHKDQFGNMYAEPPRAPGAGDDKNSSARGDGSSAQDSSSGSSAADSGRPAAEGGGRSDSEGQAHDSQRGGGAAAEGGQRDGQQPPSDSRPRPTSWG